MRRFSLESFAYVLGKLPKKVLDIFYADLFADPEETAEHISLAMLYQLKIIGNFITHLATETFVQLWEFLYEEYLTKEEEIEKVEDSEMEIEEEPKEHYNYHEKVLDVITLLLKHLADKLTMNQYETDEIMFNLVDVLKIIESKSLNLLKSQEGI